MVLKAGKSCIRAATDSGSDAGLFSSYHLGSSRVLWWKVPLIPFNLLLLLSLLY